VAGADHPDAISARSALGIALLQTGDLAGAHPLLQQALSSSIRVLGPDHPGTIACRDAQAVEHLAADRAGLALKLAKRG